MDSLNEGVLEGTLLPGIVRTLGQYATPGMQKTGFVARVAGACYFSAEMQRR